MMLQSFSYLAIFYGFVGIDYRIPSYKFVVESVAFITLQGLWGVLKITDGLVIVLTFLIFLSCVNIIILYYITCEPVVFEQNKELLKQHAKVDLEILEAVRDVLKVFESTTVEMSSQRKSTASLVKPLLHTLMVSSRPKEGEAPALHQAKATLYHDLESRYV